MIEEMFITLTSSIVLLICSCYTSSIPSSRKFIIIQLWWEPIIRDYLKLNTLPYLGWLNSSLIIESQVRYNIVVQAWQMHGIILIVTIPGPNFGSDM